MLLHKAECALISILCNPGRSCTVLPITCWWTKLSCLQTLFLFHQLPCVALTA